MAKQIVTEVDVHRFVHEHPNCWASDIHEALGCSKPIVYTRLRALVESGRVRRERSSESLHFYYASVEAPPAPVDFTPSGACTSPAVLLSRSWVPGALALEY